MSELEPIADVNEIASGERKEVIVDETPALLLRDGDHYYVIEDTCTHDSQPLTDGPFDGQSITCPRHGARFDVKTGETLCMPATEGIKTFHVEIANEIIFAKPRSQEEAKSAVEPLPVVEAKSDCEVEEMQEVNLSDLTGEAKLIEALKQVIDPELMVNIVDLGLIYEVEQIEEKVNVEMTLTSPACPVGPQIMQQAKMALERLREVDLAEIRLVMTPPWTPERMTDDARDQLGIF